MKNPGDSGRNRADVLRLEHEDLLRSIELLHALDDLVFEAQVEELEIRLGMMQVMVDHHDQQISEHIERRTR
jgi:hypothetical protein